MNTTIKLKHIAFILGLSYFLFLSVVSHAQAGTGASTIISQNNNGFSIGFYGGPNITWAEPLMTSEPYPYRYGTTNAEIGYEYNLVAKLNLYKGLFFSTGVSYERQAYQTSDIGGSIIFPQFNTSVEYSISAYNIGIPLILGKSITKKKWGFYAGLGIEFYYNFEDKIIETNTSPTFTDYFFKGRIVSTANGTYNNYFFWNPMGAFGVLHARIDYKISPRLSITCMPVLHFTDPFAEDTYFSFNEIVRENILSLNMGINYNFFNNYLKGDYQDGNDEKQKIFSMGFSIVPNDVVNKITPTPGSFFFPHTNNRFSFSYAIPVQYDLSSRIALESGIAIDNFNFIAHTNNLLIGLPIVVKYYFPLDEDGNNSLYIGVGCHFDYPTNLGWLYDPAHPFILPLALGKLGYRRILGKNYYWDVNIGYEVSFNNIQSSQGNFLYAGEEPEITGLPRYVFSSVGFGCRF